MNILLPPELEQFIQTQITDGTYASANEVIQDSLRRLQAQLTQAPPSIQLRAELQTGIDDLAQGNYTRYTSAQAIATEIKALGRQHQA
jgi:putative addiction module CopG family antidote